MALLMNSQRTAQHKETKTHAHLSLQHWSIYSLKQKFSRAVWK